MTNHLDRLRIATLAMGVSALAGSAYAQAWVPSQGEGTVSVLWQDSAFTYHRRPIEKVDRGHIRADALVVDASYGLTDRITVDLSLPYVVTRYSGAYPHLRSETAPTIDDGASHGTFQDFRFALRYNLSAGRFAVTPFVGTIVPSHDYEFFAHAAPGRRLRELQVGTYVAKLLDPILPGVFVQGRYAYGFTEQILDISHNRSMGDFEIGYFVTPGFRVFALTTGQITHGGIDITPDVRAILTPAQFEHHDQIDRLNYLDVGAGGSVSITESIDLFASVLTNVSGRNGHVLGRGLNIGATWSFKRRQRLDVSTDAEAEAHSLVRCLCQKGG